MKDTLLTDETMELIAKLYTYMDEKEVGSWSMEAAQKLVADQYHYEVEHGYVLGHYDPADFYEVISEFIRQDKRFEIKQD